MQHNCTACAGADQAPLGLLTAHTAMKDADKHMFDCKQGNLLGSQYLSATDGHVRGTALKKSSKMF